MSTNVRIIRPLPFSAEIVLGAVTLKGEFTADGRLSIEGLTPEFAEAICHQIGKMKYSGQKAKPARLPKAAKTQPGTAPFPPLTSGRTSAADPPPSNPPRKGEERAAKADPPAVASPSAPQPSTPAPSAEKLETPDELRAKREARKEPKQKAKEPEPEAPPVEAAEPAPTKKPEPFVEDLQVHQAVYAAKAVDEGKAEVPKELLEAPRLRAIVDFFLDTYKLDNVNDLIETCSAWRKHVPILRDKLSTDTFKTRISVAYETVMADRPSPSNGAA